MPYILYSNYFIMYYSHFSQRIHEFWFIKIITLRSNTNYHYPQRIHDNLMWVDIYLNYFIMYCYNFKLGTDLLRLRAVGPKHSSANHEGR